MLCEAQIRLGSWVRDRLGLASPVEEEGNLQRGEKESVLCRAANEERSQSYLEEGI